MRQKIITIVFCSLILACVEHPADALQGSQEEIVFENGFTAILIENHGTPMIGSSVIVKAGSVHETASNNGVSHMLEHLLFNGTAKRTQEELYAEQAQFGIYNNAHTSQTYTNYIILAERDHFEVAIDIQSDMLFNSIIPSTKFEKEKGIVLNEIAKDWVSPRYWAEEQFQRNFFRNTPYNLTILGTPNSIREMTRKQVLDYYKTYYVPNNMTAVIVGDFDRDQMIGLLKNYFGTQSPALLPQTSKHKLDTKVFESQVLSKMSIPSPYVTVGFLSPSIDDPDYYAMSIFTRLAQRNVKRLLDEKLALWGKQPVQDVWLNYLATEDFGVLKVTAIIQEGEKSPPVIAAIQSILPQAGVAIDNEHAITNLGTEFKVQDLALLEKPHYYGMMKADAIANAGWQFAKSYSQKISTVTTNDIARLATRVFASPQSFASSIYPGSQTLEDRIPIITNQYYNGPESNTSYDRSAETLLQRWNSENYRQQIEQETSKFTWAPTESSNAQVQDKKRIRLDNGLILDIESSADSPIFALHVLAKHRAWSEPFGKEGIADLLHSLLQQGTDTLDKQALESKLSKLGATLKTRDSDAIPFDDYYNSRLYSYIRLSTIDIFADQTIHLLGELIKNPRFTKAAFDEAKQHALARVIARNAIPSRQAESLLYQEIFPNDRRAASIEGTEESIQSITLEDLKEFHERYFSPQNLILTIATGLPHEIVVQSVKKSFQNFRTINNPPTFTLTDTPTTQHDQEIRTSLGSSQSYIRMGTVFPINPADKPALTVLNSLLSSKLSFELRERQGLAYLVGSKISLMGTQAVLDIYMGTMPKTLEKSINALEKILQSIPSIAISDSTIQRVVNAGNARSLMRQLTRINQTYRTGLNELFSEHPNWIPPSPMQLKQVTTNDVKRVMKTYFTSPAFVKIIIE